MAINIGNVQRLVPGLIERLDGAAKIGTPKPAETQEGSFTELFSNLLNSVNEIQGESAQIQQDMLNGEPVELHEVMIKAEEAGIAMDLMLEVRNKLMNAYNDLMKMPI